MGYHLPLKEITSQKVHNDPEPAYRSWTGRISPVERLADLLGLNAFFCRRGRPPGIYTGSKYITSPAQGKVDAVGIIDANGIVPEKNTLGMKRQVHLADLLRAGSITSEFAGGAYLKIYLSPLCLHYLLFPYSGTILEMHYYRGLALPIAFIRSADVHNERLTTIIQTEHGFPLALIMIGSWMVNGIHAHHEIGVQYTQGDLFGSFRVGSTVVLLAPPRTVDWIVQPGQRIDLGSPLGVISQYGNP